MASWRDYRAVIRSPPVGITSSEGWRGASRFYSEVGIRGQAPATSRTSPDSLVEAGTGSISLNPDSVLPVIRRVAEAEARNVR